MSTEFSSSASAQALGYIYQIPYALYLILTGPVDAKHSIRMEGLDDIEFWTKDKLSELLQLKRHGDRTKNLTDRSEDLWRSIRAWSIHFQEGKISLPGTNLKLITTAQSAEDSIASLLGTNKETRNTEKALRRLLSVAESPTTNLEKFTRPFMKLFPLQRGSLVEAIEILTDSPDFSGLDEKVKHEIRLLAPGHIEELYQDILGWWVIQIQDHLLNGSVEMISANTVSLRIHEKGRHYLPDALPPYSRDAELPETPNVEKDSRQFVAQLRAIELKTRQIETAMREHYQACTDRIIWIERDLLFVNDLDTFDKRLGRKWEEYCDRLDGQRKREGRTISDDIDNEEGIIWGQEIYEKIQDINLPIKEDDARTAYSYVTRGSYHKLADENPPKVWWHPKYSH